MVPQTHTVVHPGTVVIKPVHINNSERERGVYLPGNTVLAGCTVLGAERTSDKTSRTERVAIELASFTQLSNSLQREGSNCS